MQRLVCIVILALVGGSSARASDLNGSELRAAQDLNDIKCAKCHKLYHPADYSPAEWDGWMKKMSRKAKLKRPQQELLTRYFETLRDKPATKAAPAQK